MHTPQGQDPHYHIKPPVSSWDPETTAGRRLRCLACGRGGEEELGDVPGGITKEGPASLQLRDNPWLLSKAMDGLGAVFLKTSPTRASDKGLLQSLFVEFISTAGETAYCPGEGSLLGQKLRRKEAAGKAFDENQQQNRSAVYIGSGATQYPASHQRLTNRPGIMDQQLGLTSSMQAE
ncbi:hypothetical protein DPEC_G00331210 [Dallia pectoralis]|uniref:Uncharacterized protein n=1 Tax=Dallia pectoralis TaxID=75939 RepID=A0ACC2F927_DALPE|nr:hypothetical protein DPEC_G00331210 [Dallia pectoralis]